MPVRGGRCAQELWPLAPVRVASGVASLSDLSISVRSYVPSSASGPPAWSLVPASPRPSMDHARGTVSVCASRGRAQTRAAPHDGSHTRGVHGAGGERTAPGRPDAARGTADAETPRRPARTTGSRGCVCVTPRRERAPVPQSPTPQSPLATVRARARYYSFFSFILYVYFLHIWYFLSFKGCQAVYTWLLGRFINRTRPMREQNKFMDVYRVEGPTCSLT